jgi:hypothetical protein
MQAEKFTTLGRRARSFWRLSVPVRLVSPSAAYMSHFFAKDLL